MTSQPHTPFPFIPLVIIGAGRSGTNALRDALTGLYGFASWRCDEINPIWRHGNSNWPDDEIPPENATASVQAAIRRAFRRIWRQQGYPDVVVEKTCANSLRVPFVEAVLPEARYIHLVRNGVDVVASAQKRWRGEPGMPGLPYYLAKARYTPLTDLPRCALSTLRNRLALRTGRQAHFTSWGPEFCGIRTLSGRPLDEIVARQWAACVQASDRAFAQIDPARVFQLRYEDFTADPTGTLRRILHWLGEPRPDSAITRAAAIIRQDSVGKGTSAVATFSDTVRQVLETVMQAHGYQSVQLPISLAHWKRISPRPALPVSPMKQDIPAGQSRGGRQRITFISDEPQADMVKERG